MNTHIPFILLENNMPSLVLPLMFLYAMSAIVFGLYYIVEVYEDTLVEKVVPTLVEDFETTRTFSHSTFTGRDWVFSDHCILEIIQFMRAELSDIDERLPLPESHEIAFAMFDLTPLVEEYIYYSKRLQFRTDLYHKITDITFEINNEAKRFLIRSIFKSIHNQLTNDVLRKKK